MDLDEQMSSDENSEVPRMRSRFRRETKGVLSQESDNAMSNTFARVEK